MSEILDCSEDRGNADRSPRLGLVWALLVPAAIGHICDRAIAWLADKVGELARWARV